MRIVLFVALAGPLLGTSYTWVGGTPAAGPYPWNTAANWNPAGFPNSNMDSAAFTSVGSPAYRIIQVNDTFTLNNIAFNNSSSFSLLPKIAGNSLILYNSAGNSQISNASGSHYFYVPISLFQSDLTVLTDSSTNTYFYSPISESSLNVNIRMAHVTSAGSVYFGAENTYTGTLTIAAGTLFLVGDGALSPLSSLSLVPATMSLDSTFDISNINRPSITIADLSGNNGSGGSVTVYLGSKNLTFGTSNSTVFSETLIYGPGGSLTKQGTGVFTFNTTNGAAYTGPTTINEGTLASGAIQAFPSNSDFILNGTATLDLAGFNNDILTLNGNSTTSNVTNSGANAALAVLEGGTFYGTVSGPVHLVAEGGTLNLYGNNTHNTTSVLLGSVLGIGNDNALGTVAQTFANNTVTFRALQNVSPPNNFVIQGTNVFDLQNYTMTLSGNITDPSSIGTVNIIGSAGGILTLSGANTYRGTTTVGPGVTVVAGSPNALSPFSNFVMQGPSTLNLLNFSSSVGGLTGDLDSIIDLGLGQNLVVGGVGGTYAGVIQGAGTLFTAVTNLNLTGSNTFAGGATVTDGTLALLGNGTLLPTGAVAVNSSVGFTSTFDISGITDASRTIGDLSATGTGSIVNLGNKNLTFGTNVSTIFSGSITGNGGSITKQGTGTFKMSGVSSNYTGPTSIYEGIFQGGLGSAFSSVSDFILYNSAILDLNGFSQAIRSLNGTNPLSTVTNTGAMSVFFTINNGGSFSGTITDTLDPLSLFLSAGTLNLYGNNSYKGFTFLNDGSTLGVGSDTALGTSFVTLNPSSTLRALANVSLGNDIALQGTSFIDVQNYAMTLSGAITDAFGAGSVSIVGQANGVLTLSGANTYGAMTGTTTLIGPVRLLAGNTTGLSPLSNFILQGTSTLDLGGFNNTIYSLSGLNTTTLVTNSGIADATLTIQNGGSYYGQITDGFTNTLGIQLNGGILSLYSPNTYSGDTTINGSSTVRALAPNAFSPNSLVSLTMNGVLDLNGFDNTIAGLQGTSSTQVLMGSNSTLTINGGLTKTFSGQILNAPCGSLVIDGGTILTLNGNGSSYCGTTNIINGTLNIQGTSSLSPDSAITVQPLGTLTLGAFTNIAPSLTTSGTVTSTGGGLTLSGAFTETAGTVINSNASLLANQISITGGEFFNVGGSTLAGTGVNPTLSISGGVLANGTMCTTTSCSTNLCISTTNVVGNTSTAISFTGGLLHTNGAVTGASYAQGPNATLNLTMCSTPSTFGQIRADGAISLDGALVVTDNSATFMPTPNSFFSLVVKPNATVGIDSHTGQFSSITLQNFPASPVPRVITVAPHTVLAPTVNLSVVTLYFSECVASWNTAGSGHWDDSTNWNPACVPGVTTPPAIPVATNDGAIFPNVAAPTVTVTLDHQDPINPLVQTAVSPILLTMDFTANTTSYTINAFSGGGSQIIFDATPLMPASGQITVTAGSHTINAPILLNIETDLLLTDAAQLTFGTGTTMTSGSAVAGFFVAQGLLSTFGTGQLTNSGHLTPSFFTLESATVQNNAGAFISPTGAFNIAPVAGHTAHLINIGTINPGSLLFTGNGTILVDNSGVGAVLGSSQPGGTLTISGPGPITVNNSGVGAVFGSSGSNADLIVNSTGSVIFNNSGPTAIFGPSGAGSQFTIGGSGPVFLNNTGEAAGMVASGAGASFTINNPNTIVLNQGLNVVMGSTGTQGNVTINAGSVQNSLGATLKAGDGGLLTIAGGTVTNDLSSQIGALNQNLLFSAGSLINSGSIYAFDYTQDSAADLTLTLTSVERHGFIESAGTLTLNNAQLSVEALPGFTATASDVLVLLSADRGYTGNFTTVDFTGFSSNLLPALAYFPTTIDLVFSGAITPSANTTSTSLGVISVTSFNLILGREMTFLHDEMYRRERWHVQDKEEDLCVAREVEGSLLVSRNVVRKEEQLKDQDRKDRPWRVYMGPIGSVGELQNVGSQAEMNYSSMGVFGGLDHMGDSAGLGVAIDYENTTGDVHHRAGHLKLQQLHGSVYGSFLVKGLPEMSVGVILGGGYDWYSLSRVTGPTIAPVSAKGHTHGTEWDGLIDLEYIFSHQKYEKMPASLEIIPTANLQYVGVSVKGFKEKNAGIFDLEYPHQFRDSLRSYLGNRLIHTVGTSFCTLRTEIDLGWQREYLDNGYDLDVATIEYVPTKHFTEHVHGLGRNTFLLGLDLLLTTYERFQVEASYDLQYNDRQINNSFYLGIGGKF